MSHFLSCVKKDGELWYLTTVDIESNRGKELRAYTKAVDDLRGHGAVRWFYGLQGGKDVEYQNFSTPHNIPPEIVHKILKGCFYNWFGLIPPRILLPNIYTSYVKKAMILIKDYYGNKNPPTFKEYLILMLSLQEESWSLIRDKENRMSLWRI